MKKFLSIFLVVATLLSVVGCKKDKKESEPVADNIDMSSIYLLGFTKKTMAEDCLLTTQERETYKMAVKIDAATIEKKGNKQVIGVRFFAGDGAESGKIFMAYELGSNIVEKEFTCGQESWKYVLFDEPINLEEGKDIFFGYEATGVGSLLGVESNSSTLSKNSYLYWNNKWQTFKAVGASSYGASIQAICVGGDYDSEKQHDAVAAQIKIRENVRAGEIVDFTGEVYNLGIKTSGTINVVCKYGDQVVNETAANLRNGEGKLFNFTINGIGFDMDKITLEVSEESDENKNNNKLTTNINIFAQDAPERNCILIEEFTSQSCPNCPAGIATLRKAIAGMQHPEKAAWVAHHSGFNNDIFTLNADLTVASRLGVNFAPACIIDRMSVKYSGSTKKYAWHPGNATSALLDELAAIPANATIAMNVELQDSTLTVDVNGMSYPNDCYITVLICQNGIVASQSSGGNDFVHNEVVRAFLTAAEGDKLTLDGDKNYSAHYTYDIPATITGETSAGKETATDIPNMYVVAFVHGKTSSKSAVYNAIKADIVK